MNAITFYENKFASLEKSLWNNSVSSTHTLIFFHKRLNDQIAGNIELAQNVLWKL